MREQIKKILRESTDPRKLFSAIKNFFEGKEIEAFVWDYTPVQVVVKEVHLSWHNSHKLLFTITVVDKDGHSDSIFI
jgi:predicted RNA binding protein with dsRBD fold (UPF0201 family)